MKKRLQNFLMILFTLLMFGTVSISQAATQAATSNFSDVAAEHPYDDAVLYLKTQGFVQGYPDGKFLPDQTITRAEFVKILMEVSADTFGSSGEEFEGKDCFLDVQDQWFAKYICTAKQRRLLSGYRDGNFRPGQNINFVEASKVMTKAFKFSTAVAAKNEAWFKPFVTVLEQKKAIPVSIDYTDKKLSRGEMAEIVTRLATENTNKTTKTYKALTSEFPVISSCPELQEKFAAYRYSQNRGRRYFIEEMSVGTSALKMAIPVTAPQASEAESAPAATGMDVGMGGGGDPDYSSTNVQVEGVDEADVVKNDGQHVYLVKGNTIRIVKAFPPTEMRELPKITFGESGFYPQEMYVSGNKLVVVGNVWKEKSRTKLYVFDMADRSNVREERNLEFDGNYLSSRRIGERVYLVTNEYPGGYPMPYGDDTPDTSGSDLLPKFRDSLTSREMPVVPCSQVHFYPRYSEPNYLIVAGISLESGDRSVSREVFMGMGGTVYASQNNLYVAAQKNEYDEQIRYNIWQPPVTNERTMLYRFELNDGKVEYKGQGSVAGHLLNQFSMDEHNGYFRVATTKGEVWNSQTPSENNLYVLDVNNMGTIVGKIEGMARGERIYSVRFLGDRAYMVTFKKVDPFFVLDVSEPANPRVLGELKIPGYSDYLHPYDENHIIGFGKEAVDPTELEQAGFNNNAFDFAWYQGMKVALFDVTDVANPKLQFKTLIGDRGTDSELLSNHKALLFDKSRGLLAFPVTVNEIPEEEKARGRGNSYGIPVFQGAYVYTLDLKNGFQLKGRITHQETADHDPYGWQNYNYNINRIVRIGDYLYTVSQGKVKATDKNSISDVNAVTLEDGPDESPPVIMY